MIKPTSMSIIDEIDSDVQYNISKRKHTCNS
jgi:hypothetical protein